VSEFRKEDAAAPQALEIRMQSFGSPLMWNGRFSEIPTVFIGRLKRSAGYRQRSFASRIVPINQEFHGF